MIAINSQDDPSNLGRDLVRILRRRFWTILLVFLAAVTSAYGALQLLAEQYESDVSLLVKLGRENTEVPLAVDRGGIYSTGVRLEEINSEIHLLVSRELKQAVIERLGPDAFKSEEPDPETFLQKAKFFIKQRLREIKRAVNEFLVLIDLRKSLTGEEKMILAFDTAIRAERVKDSDVIAVSCRLGDPDLCVRTLEILMELYLEKHVDVRRAVKVQDLFFSQVEDYEKELVEAEQKKKALRSKWNVSSLNEERTILLKRLHDLRKEFSRSEEQLALLRQKRARLQSVLADMPDKIRHSETVITNPSAQFIKERLTSLRLERVRIAGRYQPGFQPVKDLDEEIRKLEALSAEEPPTWTGSVTIQLDPMKQRFSETVTSLEVDAYGLQTVLEKQREQAIEIEADLAELNACELDLEIAERERKIAEENYLSSRKRREEARISAEFDLQRISNVSILSEPTRPVLPVYPRKMLLMGLAVAIGLILGVALALFLEYMNDRISTKRDLASIDGLDYLGTVGPRRGNRCFRIGS